jgi:hypothetical protein
LSRGRQECDRWRHRIHRDTGAPASSRRTNAAGRTAVIETELRWNVAPRWAADQAMYL